MDVVGNHGKKRCNGHGDGQPARILHAGIAHYTGIAARHETGGKTKKHENDKTFVDVITIQFAVVKIEAKQKGKEDGKKEYDKINKDNDPPWQNPDFYNKLIHSCLVGG